MECYVTLENIRVCSAALLVDDHMSNDQESLGDFMNS